MPGIPLPLADLVIVLLGAFVLAGPRPWQQMSPAFVAAGLYAVIASCWLVLDFPTWGRDAARDYSLAVELLALPVGYWVVARFGLPRFVFSMLGAGLAVTALGRRPQ